MYTKNTFKVPVSWSFLILYEPSWWLSGYFQFYTYVDPIDKNTNPDPRFANANASKVLPSNNNTLIDKITES